MKVLVRYDEKIDCVIGQFEGCLTLKALKVYAQEISQVTQESPCRRFLNDLRKAEIKLSVNSLSEAPQIIVSDEFDHNWARAILIRSDYMLTHRDFFEMLTYNRGIKVKTFTEYNDAIKWLNGTCV